MKSMTSVLCSLLPLVLAWAVSGSAQNDAYQLTYYANELNAFATDQTVRIVNPGMQGSPISLHSGNLCADIYVFDANQNLQECCGCVISANGVLKLSLTSNLLQNPASGSVSSSGVIKVISSSSVESCNPTSVTPLPNLRASMEHLEIIPPPPGRHPFFERGTPFLVLAPFQGSILSGLELERLTSACGSIVANHACTCGSGG